MGQPLPCVRGSVKKQHDRKPIMWSRLAAHDVARSAWQIHVVCGALGYIGGQSERGYSVAHLSSQLLEFSSRKQRPEPCAFLIGAAIYTARLRGHLLPPPHRVSFPAEAPERSPSVAVERGRVNSVTLISRI